ncbi:MAG: ABC transporter permease [Chloroflexota bacterium]
MRIAKGGLTIVGILAYSFFVLPIFALFVGAINGTDATSLPDTRLILDAIALSLRTSAISLVVIILLGTPLAYIFARWQFWGKKVAQVTLELPLVMPPAVAGLALLLTFGRRGLLGDFLLAADIQIVFTQLAVIIAQIFVAAPFYIRTAQIGFANVPLDLEDAARVDGATDRHVFWYITLPLALRALIAGLVLSWARAIGEFGATILFAGSLQGRTQTMPLLVYAEFERDINAAIWTGIILLTVAFFALLLSQILAPQDDANT